MKKQHNNLTQEELNLIEETERFMEEVNADPEVAKAELPPELHEKLMKKVYEKKAERDAEAEREELVRLGKVYKKRRKARKYWVLAAAAVLAMALGITSMGGGERILEVLKLDKLGRDQTQTNTDGAVKPLENITEEEVYQWIEDEYGVYPVVMRYRPKGIGFIQAKMPDAIHSIVINYGTSEQVNIICKMYPNQVEHSHAIDVEDAVVDEFSTEIKGCLVDVRKYQEENEIEPRWVLEFTHKNIWYIYNIVDVEWVEVEKIINNLYF